MEGCSTGIPIEGRCIRLNHILNPIDPIAKAWPIEAEAMNELESDKCLEAHLFPPELQRFVQLEGPSSFAATEQGRH